MLHFDYGPLFKDLPDLPYIKISNLWIGDWCHHSSLRDLTGDSTRKDMASSIRHKGYGKKENIMIILIRNDHLNFIMHNRCLRFQGELRESIFHFINIKVLVQHEAKR